jgi:hypothetical protein
MNDMIQAIQPKSDQINADDLIGREMDITVTGVQIDSGQDQPVSISFAESDKVYRPCKSMSRVLVAVWGPDAKAYVGKSMTLYRDPDVKWGGMAVGGIRIRAMSDMEGGKPVVMALTATKGARKPYTVKPMIAQSNPILAAARAAARNGTESFREWFRANPGKRDATKPILDELKALAADADAAVSDDPFGLPPIDPTPTEAEIAAAMEEARREVEERDGGAA